MGHCTININKQNISLLQAILCFASAIPSKHSINRGAYLGSRNTGPLRKLAHAIHVYRDFFTSKIEKKSSEKKDIFNIFAQNIDRGYTRGYTLELPRRGSSNEYPQSMFWTKNKKNMYTPAYPSFTYKCGV